MVGEWLPDVRVAARPLQIVPRGGIGAQRIRGRSVVAGDDGVAIGLARVVDEEAAARRVVRRQRQAEQATLTAAEHDCGQIQKWGWVERPVVDDANATDLFDDEHHVRLRGVLDNGDGGGKTRHHEDRGDLRECRGSPEPQRNRTQADCPHDDDLGGSGLQCTLSGTRGRQFSPPLYASAFPYNASSRLQAFSACASL